MRGKLILGGGLRLGFGGAGSGLFSIGLGLPSTGRSLSCRSLFRLW